LSLLKAELEEWLENAQQETILHESMTCGEMTAAVNFKSLSYIILYILKSAKLSLYTYCLRSGH